MGAIEAASILQRACTGVALGCFVGSILCSAAAAAAVVICLLAGQFSLAFGLAAALFLLAKLPLETSTEAPWPFSAFVRWCCHRTGNYFPIRMVYEDKRALKGDRTYIVGLEPHSALPSAIPAAFGLHSPLLPPALAGRCHALASSACFKIPLVRHLYWWWGFRSIDRGSMVSLLRAGKCVVLVPGGVQECLFMQHGRELAFVKNRRGFIRVALEEGADVVPVFAFGQSQVLDWVRPGPPLISEAAVQHISRRIGFVPMLAWGWCGTTMPKPVMMTVVIGAPIAIPKTSAPSGELVQRYLDMYIDSLQRLFDSHKAAAGYPDLQLDIM